MFFFWWGGRWVDFLGAWCALHKYIYNVKTHLINWIQHNTQHTTQRRIAQLPLTPQATRGLLLRRAEPNPNNQNGAVELVFQIGALDLKTKVIFEGVDGWMDGRMTRCFNFF